MMNFNLMKNILFPIFHEHKNTELNYFNPIFERGKFWGVTGSRTLMGLYVCSKTTT